jgi:hypothetical protein
MKVKSTTLHSLLAVAAGMVFLASTAGVNAQFKPVLQQQAEPQPTRSRSKRAPLLRFLEVTSG